MSVSLFKSLPPLSHFVAALLIDFSSHAYLHTRSRGAAASAPSPSCSSRSLSEKPRQSCVTEYQQQQGVTNSPRLPRQKYTDWGEYCHNQNIPLLVKLNITWKQGWGPLAHCLWAGGHLPTSRWSQHMTPPPSSSTHLHTATIRQQHFIYHSPDFTPALFTFTFQTMVCHKVFAFCHLKLPVS